MKAKIKRNNAYHQIRSVEPTADDFFQLKTAHSKAATAYNSALSRATSHIPISSNSPFARASYR